MEENLLNYIKFIYALKCTESKRIKVKKKKNRYGERVRIKLKKLSVVYVIKFLS
jgi:hypothetical protein